MKKTIFISILGLLSLFLISNELPAQTVSFTGSELLGRPTNNSIVINIIPDADIEFYYEYGTVSGGPYTGQTETNNATAGNPHEVVINGLSADTHYYYRMQYRISGGSWVVRDEHSFHTQRSEGTAFIFTVTSDSHAQFTANHRQAMNNIKSEDPDFNIDLGDTFMPDGTTSQSAVNNKYLAYRNTLYLGAIGPSVPIFLSSGNHEDEEGWNLDDTPFSIALGSIQARKAFYPTPVADGFYTGNTDLLPTIDEATYGDKLREDYYAWEWGDALFVVIDPFQYTMNLPYAPGAAGEGTDDIQDGDQWSWTLGSQQFNWFKQTIQNSNAKYKFVFSHNMIGGIPNLTVSGVGPGYVRGGAGAAPYFEWGGKNADGTEGFASHRDPAEFGTKPIHQLMVENGVSAYFHGHDHQYVYELLDGIVYQEVPSPSMTGSGFSGIYSMSNSFTKAMYPNAGHLRITISPSEATVDYVRSDKTEISYSYTILPNTNSGTNHTLTLSTDPVDGGTTNPSAGDHTYNENTNVNITATPATGYVFDSWTGNVANTTSASTTITMNSDQTVTAHFTEQPFVEGKSGDMNGDGQINSTDALIILSGDVGINISQFCPVNCGDVNGDGLVNSTDALIILSFDAGLSVPFEIGAEGCPVNVTPCAGCN